MAQVDRVPRLQEQLRKASGHLRALTEENDQQASTIEQLECAKQQLQAHNDELQQAVAALRNQMDAQALNGTHSPGLPPDLAPTLDSTDLSLVAQLLTTLERKFETRVEPPVEDLPKDTADIASGASEPSAILSIQQRLQALVQAAEQGPLPRDASISLTDLTTQDAHQDLPTASTHVAPLIDAVCAQFIRLVAPDSLHESLEHLSLSAKDLGLDADLKAKVNETHHAVVQAMQRQQHTITELNEAQRALQTNHTRLQHDYEELLSKVGAMKDVLAAKAQGESQELQTTRDHLAAANQQLVKCAHELAATQRELTETKDTLAMVRTQLLAAEETLSEAHEERRQIKAQADRELAELSDQCQALQTQVYDLRHDCQLMEQTLDQERQGKEGLETRYRQVEDNYQRLASAEDAWSQDRTLYLKSIDNLQAALHDLQQEKDDEWELTLSALKEQLRQSNQQCQEYQTKANQAQVECQRLATEATAYQTLKREYQDQTRLVGQLRHDLRVLEDHLAESLQKLRAASVHDNVDRRVITNLLVTFLELPYGDAKRFEVLQLMSNILQFTETEQEQVGLIRKSSRSANQSTSTAPEPEDESFSDRWISFLLKEANVDRHRSSVEK
ncbi:hypothetical protein H4R34_003735 [Dimargaris verticillata]|uniref:GRIP domain-containing protein n=1 Tax=Dimargaris verticillata TaxID=2761393 RepID=A0A9W8B6Y3_9FUNG|nr:hypothetical protein H4R34_003735 [Dimargaris verticillata]